VPIDTPAAVIDGNRLNAFGLKRAKILRGHCAVQEARIFENGFGDFAFVERIATFSARMSRARQIRIAEQVACFRWSSSRQNQRRHRILIVFQTIGPAGPRLGNDLSNGKTFAGVGDCGLEKLFQGSLPKRACIMAHPSTAPGNRHAIDSAYRHFTNAVTGRKRGSKRPRSRAECVDACKLAGFRVPIDDEAVAPEPVHHGFDHAKY
jgi:hypothetical protein